MCCGSLGHKESDMTEQVNCTELNIFIIVIPSWIHPLIIMYCPLCVLMVFILKSILSDEYCYSCFLLVSICMKYLFPGLHFQSVCILKFEVDLL